MYNLTVDDTNAVSLNYGPGWGVASSDDAALSKYFQSTYHASETAGALVNFTFSGLAVYLYGSTGPSHGNFSVRYDTKIEFLSAHSNKPQYQQLLFKGSFDSDAGPHSLTLNNTNGKWVDLDFLIITNKGGASQSQGSPSSESTIAPLPVPSRSSDGSQTSDVAGSQETPIGGITGSRASPTAAQSVQSQSSSNDTTLILATVLGTVLFLLILAVSAYFIIRRLRTASKKSPPTSTPSSHHAPSAGSVFLIGQPSPSYSYEKRFLPAIPPHPTATPTDDSTRPTPVVPFREIAPEPDVPESTREQTSSMGRNSAARPWSPLRTSPIKALFGGTAKDGEDSMKSTFLKV